MKTFTKPFNTARKKTLSLPEAIKVFNSLSEMSEISFVFTYTGCATRAHIMCQELLKRGITPKKAWAFGPNPLKRRSLRDDTEALVVDHPKNPRGIRWRYHVAPTIPVRMPNGGVEDMVLDPSIFNGPATLKEWGDIQHAKASQLDIKPWNERPRYCRFLEKAKTIFKENEVAVQKTKQYFIQHILYCGGGDLRSVFTSNARRALASTGNLHGKTWRTIPVHGK